MNLPSHCSPARKVTAGIPVVPFGDPFGTKELYHSRPLRLCVQIENAPLPLERPKLIGTIRTSRESLPIFFDL